MKTCSVEGCEKAVRARGWCSTHWQRWRRNGHPTDRPVSKRRLRAADHGTRQAYRDYGCRCEVCVSAASTCDVEGCDRPVVARGWCQNHYELERRKGLQPLPHEQLRTDEHIDCAMHPEPSARCYWAHKCRCDGCRRKNSAAKMLVKAGRSDPKNRLVDVEPVRRRLLELFDQGFMLKDVCEQSGVTQTSLKKIRDGHRTHVRQSTADAIMGMQGVPEPRFVPVDAELRRWIEAAVERLGYDAAQQHFGVSKRHLRDLIYKHKRTTPATRRRIMSQPLPCVVCGSDALAGGLRCLPCFRDQAKPKPYTGCGTEAGYAAHRRAGTKPCHSCRMAHTNYQQIRAENVG